MENTKNAVHKAAQQGFEKEAQAYARGRPDYPAALSAWLAQALGLGPGREVADVGAGTGKFTALLATTGATVVGVEPVDAMRAKIDALQLPTVRAMAGTAQAIPLSAATLDAVVCAQAFHWFATRDALDEFHRVLRPGGKLGLVWNVRDESVDWVADVGGKVVNLLTKGSEEHCRSQLRQTPEKHREAIRENHNALDHCLKPPWVLKN